MESVSKEKFGEKETDICIRSREGV